MTLRTFTAPDIAEVPDFSPEATQQFVETRRAHGLNVDRGWGLMYQSTADSIMFDHRPDYARFFYEGLRTFRTRLELTHTETSNPVQLTITSFQHLPMYILYGWETGIYNEFRHLQSRGLSKAQLMELVMFAQLQAGIRGLQLVYNAVGKYLPDWRDGPGEVPLPEGWASDPEAFKAGLDLSVRALTDADRAAITRWYESTIGYVPDSVKFAMTYHPEFYKWHRARWEIIFQKLPKQTAPYVMIAPAHADRQSRRAARSRPAGQSLGDHPRMAGPRLRGDGLLHRLRSAQRRVRGGRRHPVRR